jgi:hypothetical protein
MSQIRAKAVAEAKKAGICTQCLNNRATKGRVQCQRCIDTNKRKREKRKHKYDEYLARSYDKSLGNEYRDKIIRYAARNKICTKCFGRPTLEHRQCDICLERKRRWKIAREGERKPSKKAGRPKKYKNERERKAAQREYAKNRLYKKVRNLDRIRYAVEKGGKL